MIAHTSCGTSFSNLTRYLEEKRGGEERVAWVETRNTFEQGPDLEREGLAPLAREMQDLAGARGAPQLKKPSYQLSISFAPEDDPTRAEMRAVADRTLEDLGLGEHQVGIVAHSDTAHEHVHLVVNRVHPETGKAWDRWMDRPRIEESLRRQERERGLREVPGHLFQLGAPGIRRQAQALWSAGTLEAGQQAPDPADSLGHEAYQAARRRERRPFAEIAREAAAGPLAQAESWEDLGERLAAAPGGGEEGGGELRVEARGEGGGVLTDGTEVTKLSRLGAEHALGRLEERFGAPFSRYRAWRAADRPPEAGRAESEKGFFENELFDDDFFENDASENEPQQWEEAPGREAVPSEGRLPEGGMQAGSLREAMEASSAGGGDGAAWEEAWLPLGAPAENASVENASSEKTSPENAPVLAAAPEVGLVVESPNALLGEKAPSEEVLRLGGLADLGEAERAARERASGRHGLSAEAARRVGRAAAAIVGRRQVGKLTSARDKASSSRRHARRRAEEQAKGYAERAAPLRPWAKARGDAREALEATHAAPRAAAAVFNRMASRRGLKAACAALAGRPGRFGPLRPKPSREDEPSRGGSDAEASAEAFKTLTKRVRALPSEAPKRGVPPGLEALREAGAEARRECSRAEERRARFTLEERALEEQTTEVTEAIGAGRPHMKRAEEKAAGAARRRIGDLSEGERGALRRVLEGTSAETVGARLLEEVRRGGASYNAARIERVKREVERYAEGRGRSPRASAEKLSEAERRDLRGLLSESGRAALGEILGASRDASGDASRESGVPNGQIKDFAEHVRKMAERYAEAEAIEQRMRRQAGRIGEAKTELKALARRRAPDAEIEAARSRVTEWNDRRLEEGKRLRKNGNTRQVAKTFARDVRKFDRHYEEGAHRPALPREGTELRETAQRMLAQGAERLAKEKEREAGTHQRQMGRSWGDREQDPGLGMG